MSGLIKAKKIAHITFNMGIGGAERVIYNLVKHTDPTKYQVSVLCLSDDIGPFGIELRDKGWPVIPFNRTPGFDVSVITRIRRYIHSQDIDILHCHQYTPYVYGVLAAAFTKSKVIFTEHGRFHPDRKKVKRIVVNPFLSLLTDNITAISAATRDALVRFENFPGERIKIVYNGIEDNRSQPTNEKNLKSRLGIKDEGLVLGTVARLDPIKNQEMMIKALKKVHSIYPDAYLIIVGNGPEKERLEHLVSELNLFSRVIFTGFRMDTDKFYNIMDIFLLTSFSEGTAMTLLEAMAFGIPCIVTDVGGNPEIVLDGETGFIIPNNSIEALGDKICVLLGDPKLRNQMGKCGRKTYENRFSVETMTHSYEEIYEGRAQ